MNELLKIKTDFHILLIIKKETESSTAFADLIKSSISFFNSNHILIFFHNFKKKTFHL